MRRRARRSSRPPWSTRRTSGSSMPTMRRILVDRARARECDKRGGRLRKLDIDAIDVVSSAAPDQLVMIDEALAQLAADDPAAARLVELRYFAGLSVADAGAALGLSTA